MRHTHAVHTCHALTQAAATLPQAASALSDAQRAAAKEAAERSRLEADLVGCRSWIRELEKTEQQYLCTIRQQGALEQAAVHAERQADDLRAALAAANTDLRLAQAAGAAAARERDALLVKLTSEAQRSTLVEQVRSGRPWRAVECLTRPIAWPDPRLPARCTCPAGAAACAHAAGGVWQGRTQPAAAAPRAGGRAGAAPAHAAG